MLSLRGIAAFLACMAGLLVLTAESHMMRKEEIRSRQLEAAKAWKRSAMRFETATNDTISFSNPKAAGMSI